MQVASAMRNVTDRYLPPDHDAFVAAEPPTGRIFVIAPTRAACETIELALGLHIETVLEQQHSVVERRIEAACVDGDGRDADLDEVDALHLFQRAAERVADRVGDLVCIDLRDRRRRLGDLLCAS